MGVDYSGNYGVGVQIKLKEFEEGDQWFEDFEGFLDHALRDSNYGFFEVGEGSYTGAYNDFYVEIVNPFSNGYDITQEVSIFKAFLAEKGIEYYGNVDVVGGLNIY